MADIDLKPIFQFPDTTDTLVSYLEATRKSLRTGQVEPIRHFLQVRLQEMKDREHLLGLITKWITLIKLGQGEVVKGKHEILGHMPIGYIPSKIKGKDVLQRVIEPKQAFTDKTKTPLKLKPTPEMVKLEKQSNALVLEAYTIPSNKSIGFGLSHGKTLALLQAGLIELADSDEDLADFSCKGEGLDSVPFFMVVETIHRDMAESEEMKHDGSSVTIGVKSKESMFLPSLIGLLIKQVPYLIEIAEKPKYANKYPKLLKALVALQAVVDVIQSDK